MPTKHIDQATWDKVEEITVKAIIETKTAIKDTDMLRYLIRKGIRNMTEDDYRKIAEGKR